MPRLALADRFVATCKCPRGESQIDYFDSRTPGLALRVSQQGRKSWCFHFTAPSNGKLAHEDQDLLRLPRRYLGRRRQQHRGARCWPRRFQRIKIAL